MFHKLPSEVLAEDAEVLKLLKIEALGRPPEPEPEGGEEWATP